MTPEPPDTRRRILDASIALVAERGVREVSFREVARRAGVSHQAPYHHFGDHRGILRAIAAEGFDALTAAMVGAAARFPGAPLRALHAAGVAYVRFARANVGHFRVMFQQTLVDVHGGGAAPLEEAARTYGTLTRLARAAHRGGSAGGLGEEALAHLAWSAVHGLATLLIEGVLQGKPTGEPRDDDALVRQVVGGMARLLERS